MNYSEDELELYGKAKNYGKHTGNGDTLYDMTVEIPVKVWITVTAAAEEKAVSTALDLLSMTMRSLHAIDDYDNDKPTIVEKRMA